MICPACGTEYREGFDVCTDCHVPLIPVMDWGTDDKKKETGKPVCVLRTGDQTVLAVAKSLLDGTDISYFVKNEAVQDLFGLGRLGTGYNPLVGPMEIWVPEENEFEAREILTDLTE
ncbi:MAG: hypothetical protein A2293_05990 [Elusimicrobia bacterium RIFOXYB2_FULL_49_7]|nr:MAG: hypothetical protein A2293_05990 [Elusimicrobia bacterium RIFOXYB2_FULL_49_7]